MTDSELKRWKSFRRGRKEGDRARNPDQMCIRDQKVKNGFECEASHRVRGQEKIKGMRRPPEPLELQGW